MLDLRKLGLPPWSAAAAVFLLVVAVVVGGWYWFVERTEVRPGEFLVVTALWGRDLPEDEIIAPEGYKGVRLDVRPEGRYFFNPLFYSVERHPMVKVPAGKCLVLTRKYGKRIPPERLEAGDFLAREGERGIVAEPLGPGNHRLNPFAYSWEEHAAVEIGEQQVGVKTLKVGKDPSVLKEGQRASPYVVPEGYRGVQDKPVSNGTYYVNPYVASVVPVDTSSHPVEFVDIDFPSRDGFRIRPHVKLSYKVLPAKAPEMFVMLSDAGLLHQKDATPAEQEENEILKKVILPMIRGYVRTEGSKVDARDFFTSDSGKGEEKPQNPRERLAQDLAEKVQPQCQKLGIIVEQITLTQPEQTAELAELVRQIADRKTAIAERNTNEQKIEEIRSELARRSKELMKPRETKLGKANQELAVAEERAKQDKKVAEAVLKTDVLNAQDNLEAAKKQAEATLTKGENEAKLITAQNEAQVAGLRKAVEGFPSADHYAQYQLMSKLAPALQEIFASDTSEFAKLFSTYMAPLSAKPGAGKPDVAPGGGGTAPMK